MVNDYEFVADRLYKEHLAEKLNGKRVLVTGASGLIGSQIGKSILSCNKKYGTNINVVLHDIALDRIEARYGEDLKRKDA